MFGKTEIRTSSKPRDGRHCDLCGCSFPAVRCDKCSSQIFCLSCDDMYHRHPKRRFHLRKAVDPTPTVQARPVLPMKVSSLTLAPGDPSKMPLPPPRKKKPGKSIFDSFRRASPSSDTSPHLPKKEYSWTDRIGSITKFMSNRPLPPVPDGTKDTDSDVPANATPTSNHDLSFIHKRVDEKPPALPQRQPRNQQQMPFDEQTDGTANNQNANIVNGNSANFGVTMDGHPPWMMHQPFPNQNEVLGFGTIRRQSEPQEKMDSQNAKGMGMHQSSSATDLTSLSDASTLSQMQHYPPFAYNPHLPPPYPYPMYPQYPGYPQYFGNSWMNLASPHPSTDADFSDQSEATNRRSNRGRHKSHLDKKAKRSQSVLVDRMGYPGPFYPFGPYPGGYPGHPWMSGHSADAPSSPSVSMRSLSRLSQNRHQKATDDDDDDYSSSPVSRPKSSSSEMSKNRVRAKPKSCPSSSSSEQERTESHAKPKASPSAERRRYAKQQQKLRKKSASPRRSSLTRESKKDSNLNAGPEHHEGESESNDPDQQASNKVKAPSSSNQRKNSVGSEDTGRTWQCKHCTYINPASSSICQVCCKTACIPELPADQGADQSADQGADLESKSSNIQSLGIEAEMDQARQHASSKNSDRDRHDIAVLNSALDEAEKQINQSLEELLKVKEESPVLDSAAAESKQPAFRSPSSPDSSHLQNKFKDSSQNTPSSAVDKSPVSSLPTQKTVSDASSSTGNLNEESAGRIRYPRAAKDVTVSPTAVNHHMGTHKDSFCQTYQDVPQEYPPQQSRTSPIRSMPLSQNARIGPRLYERQELLSPNAPYNAYQPSSPQERTFGGNFTGMHRGHSMASLYTGSANDSGPSTGEYTGMGFGQPSMVRSLSRASLLGETESWSEYPARPKLDFYLSMEELVERRRQETMRAQGLELVRMIREAEQKGFTADDIQVALNNCGKQNPVNWLLDNWKNVIRTVVTLATNYGKDKRENDVGALSENEARDALRLHKGNIWAAVTECVEGRQRKFLELGARGNFTFKEIVDALTESSGDVEIAYAKLTNTTLQPFLMRIWGSGEGVPNLEGASPQSLAPVERLSELSKSGRMFDNEGMSDEEAWDEEDFGNEDWEEDEYEEHEGEMGEREASVGRSSQDLTSYQTDDLEESEKYHTLAREDIALSPESDKSDYGDAFGSGLGERYLSSTSIDEIYLIDGAVGDEELILQPRVNPEGPRRKSTGFLSKLAALRDTKLSKTKENLSVANDGISRLNDHPLVNDSALPKDEWTSNIIVEDDDSSVNFNPLAILKQTFSALKETVSGKDTKSEKNSPSIYEKRTIIVGNAVAQDASCLKSVNEISVADDLKIFTDEKSSTSACEGKALKCEQDHKIEETLETGACVKKSKHFSDVADVGKNKPEVNLGILEKGVVIKNERVTTESWPSKIDSPSNENISSSFKSDIPKVKEVSIDKKSNVTVSSDAKKSKFFENSPSDDPKSLDTSSKHSKKTACSSLTPTVETKEKGYMVSMLESQEILKPKQVPESKINSKQKAFNDDVAKEFSELQVVADKALTLSWDENNIIEPKAVQEKNTLEPKIVQEECAAEPMQESNDKASKELSELQIAADKSSKLSSSAKNIAKSKVFQEKHISVPKIVQDECTIEPKKASKDESSKNLSELRIAANEALKLSSDEIKIVQESKVVQEKHTSVLKMVQDESTVELKVLQKEHSIANNNFELEIKDKESSGKISDQNVQNNEIPEQEPQAEILHNYIIPVEKPEEQLSVKASAPSQSTSKKLTGILLSLPQASNNEQVSENLDMDEQNTEIQKNAPSIEDGPSITESKIISLENESHEPKKTGQKVNEQKGKHKKKERKADGPTASKSTSAINSSVSSGTSDSQVTTLSLNVCENPEPVISKPDPKVTPGNSSLPTATLLTEPLSSHEYKGKSIENSSVTDSSAVLFGVNLEHGNEASCLQEAVDKRTTIDVSAHNEQVENVNIAVEKNLNAQKPSQAGESIQQTQNSDKAAVPEIGRMEETVAVNEKFDLNTQAKGVIIEATADKMDDLEVSRKVVAAEADGANESDSIKNAEVMEENITSSAVSDTAPRNTNIDMVVAVSHASVVSEMNQSSQADQNEAFSFDCIHSASKQISDVAKSSSVVPSNGKISSLTVESSNQLSVISEEAVQSNQLIGETSHPQEPTEQETTMNLPNMSSPHIEIGMKDKIISHRGHNSLSSESPCSGENFYHVDVLTETGSVIEKANDEVTMVIHAESLEPLMQPLEHNELVEMVDGTIASSSHVAVLPQVSVEQDDSLESVSTASVTSVEDIEVSQPAEDAPQELIDATTNVTTDVPAVSESAVNSDSDNDDDTSLRASSPVRPVGHLRRMSFNTKRVAIFHERNRDLPLTEQKTWFLPKKIETFKPAVPKRTIKQQLEFERKVRKLVSDKKCRTYRKAEIVAQLLELKFEETEAIYAANECSNLEQAISFLQQECQLCAGKYPIAEMVSMTHCSHKACQECIKAYFTIQIRDRTIMELLCPFCNEPDIADEDVAQDYFNHLDIMLKKLLDDDIHELFQRKLRDRVLMKDPNFRWCSQCSSGFITDPYLKRLICPDCKAITCASCRRLWEREHEGVSCEAFATWKDANDPETQTTGLAKLLTEDGIDCPSCHFRYALAKGGCMHFKCIQCQHDFCSGCSRPFKMGKKCGLSDFCVKLGLHAHHPRNCLFYLRDKEPEDLKRLLDMNDVTYNKDRYCNVDGQRVCDVLEQKETSKGMVDDLCGKDVEYGFAGLCRIHYVEYLGQLVNKHKVDPIHIFDNDDLELVLKRASIRLPPKKYRESAEEYREKLVDLIEDKLPLGEMEGS